jgi:hypothetical protein
MATRTDILEPQPDHSSTEPHLLGVRDSAAIPTALLPVTTEGPLDGPSSEIDPLCCFPSGQFGVSLSHG